jgi:hypothetical protein
MSGQESGYFVMPSWIEMTGREFWMASHELQALWNQLQEGLAILASLPMNQGKGPAWGTDVIGQTYGPDYTEAMELIKRAMEWHAAQLNAAGKEMAKGATGYVELDEQTGKSFAEQLVRSRPLEMIQPW